MDAIETNIAVYYGKINNYPVVVNSIFHATDSQTASKISDFLENKIWTNVYYAGSWHIQSFCFLKIINQIPVVKFLEFEEEIALGVYLSNLTKLKSSQLVLAHS